MGLGLPPDHEAVDPLRERRDGLGLVARRLGEKLGWDEKRLMTTFQSRFGPEDWLQPYTDITLRELAESGTRRVQVVCPGFAVDCLETLEEIAMQNAELFQESGGEKLEYIPALNDSESHVRVMREIVGV